LSTASSMVRSRSAPSASLTTKSGANMRCGTESGNDPKLANWSTSHPFVTTVMRFEAPRDRLAANSIIALT
jgi:hypothetical protein